LCSAVITKLPVKVLPVFATNVDTQDRGLYFKFNGTGDGRTPDSLATLIAAKTGRTLTGNFVMTAEHNHVVPAGYVLECGLVSTGATVFGNNATDTDDGTSPSSSGTFTGTSGEGIEIQIDGATSTVSGICEVTIYLDSGTG